MQYFNKYNGMSSQSMYSAVANGSVKVGSERYNMLPEAQRTAFEQYKMTKDAPSGIPTVKEEAFNPQSPENTVDFQNIESFIGKMFSGNLREKANEARNDNRVVDLSTKLNAQASDLEKFDLDGIKAGKRLQDDLGNEGFSPAMIRAEVQDYNANRAIERMGKVSEYNRVQGDLQSIKDDIENDLELFKYEDQQAKEKYSMLFSIYESRRGEQRAEAGAAADREFAREEKAEDREYQNQREEFRIENDNILDMMMGE